MCPTTIHKQNDSQKKAYGKNVQKTDSFNERTEKQNDNYNNAATTKQNSGTAFEMRWHAHRNQISSFSETDECI